MAVVVVTASDAGRSVRAAAGDQLVLKLAENPTTGFRWHVDVPAAVRLVADDFAPSSGAAGAGGERVITLLMAAPGRHTVAATLRRSWDVSAAAAAPFSVIVEVA